jgi:protein TonB
MRYAWLGIALLAACSPEDAAPPQEDPVARTRGFEAPVVTNAESPIGYPTDLYRQGVEGTVILRLFVDENATVVPDSTQIAEGSGYPALDSAALEGVAEMRFAPARRDGQPVATSFLQPVHFRRPDGSGGGGTQ